MVTVFEGIFICYSHLAFFLTSILNWLKQKKKEEEKKHVLLREKKNISSPFHLSFKKAKRHYAIYEKKQKKQNIMENYELGSAELMP